MMYIKKTNFKPLYVCLIICICFCNLGWGQLQKGNMLLGGQLGNLQVNLKDEGRFSLGIYPKVGYFITNNFVIGIEPRWQSSFGKGYLYNNFGLGIFSRIYIHGNTLNLINKGRFFLEGGFGVANEYVRVKGNNLIQISSDFLTYYNFGLGYAYFLSQQVGLDVVAGFNGDSNLLIDDENLNFGVRVGLQIYFPKKHLNDSYQKIRKGSNDSLNTENAN